jgi:hypothetical protein
MKYVRTAGFLIDLRRLQSQGTYRPSHGDNPLYGFDAPHCRMSRWTLLSLMR